MSKQDRRRGGVALWGVPLCLTLTGVACALFARRMVGRSSDKHRELEETARSLTRRNSQLRALSNVFAQIADDLSLEHVIVATLRETLRIMDADMATVRRLVDGKLIPERAMLRDGREVQVFTEIPLGEGHTGRAAELGRTFRIDSGAELAMASLVKNAEQRSPSEQSRSGRQESGVIAPLIAGSRVLGTLAVWSRNTAAFTPEDEAILEMMASQAATAMVAASTLEEHERLSQLDALTGLPNRLKLALDTEADLDKLAKAGRKAVFVMADIDHFKQFNDDYGHAAGDDALRQVAEALRSGIRSGDRVYRYGGEEFLLVFRDSGIEEAYALAERVRLAVEEQVETPKAVTISIGLAALPRHGTHAAALIERADAAMYQAKSAGRNRTAIWESPAQPKAA